jgi:hypothetical protein
VVQEMNVAPDTSQLTKSKRLQKVSASLVSDALDRLQYARAEGDGLKIALCEAALNDLLDQYSCHTCHGSQPERAKS